MTRPSYLLSVTGRLDTEQEVLLVRQISAKQYLAGVLASACFE